MMNIRDYFSINKTKTSNKIKILDLLGFEPDIEIDSSQYKENIVVRIDRWAKQRYNQKSLLK